MALGNDQKERIRVAIGDNQQAADIVEAIDRADVTTEGTAEAGRALVLDSNKDFTGVRNGTFTGKVNLGLNGGAASASGLLTGVGTTAAPATTSTADAIFVELRCKSTATSGDNRLMYLRHELAGTGGGECIRAFTKIQGTVGTARGAHVSIDFDATVGDKATGLAAGLDCQLLLPNKAIEAGVGAYTALNIEIYSAGATTDPANCNKLSYIRVVNGGHADGIADVDDDAYFIDMVGVTEGANNMVVASATEANYATGVKCRINGVEKWLMFASASG